MQGSESDVNSDVRRGFEDHETRLYSSKCLKAPPAGQLSLTESDASCGDPNANKVTQEAQTARCCFMLRAVHRLHAFHKCCAVLTLLEMLDLVRLPLNAKVTQALMET